MDLIEAISELVKHLGVRQAFPTAAFSADDDPGKANAPLIDLALKAVGCAARTDLSDLSRRLTGPPYWPDVWPGEHYKLLAGLVEVLQPRLAVEIGTATGLSALALAKSMPRMARVVTFDIVPWRQYPGHVLTDADFQDGRLQQFTDDLTDPLVARRHATLLGQADLIFIDAAKDGKMEPALMMNLANVGLKEGALLVFDDIRMLTMLPLWRQIALPKLDLTSFGHWSGTGLALWFASVSWIGGRQ